MSTQLLSRFEAETPKFIQFSQLTGRSQAQLENKRFFAAYVLIEYNQFGGVKKEILLIADSEIQAQKYEREFPAYQLIVGIPRAINSPAQLQALKSEKVGPAFNSIQKPAHLDSDYSSVAADNSFTVTPKFAINERVLVLKKWFLIEIKNYTFEVIGDPKKTGLTLLYVDSDGDKYYEDELRSNLDECRMCEELTVYKNECVVCGWENHPGQMPEEQIPHPSMSAAERNGHFGPAWRK